MLETAQQSHFKSIPWTTQTAGAYQNYVGLPGTKSSREELHYQTVGKMIEVKDDAFFSGYMIHNLENIHNK